MAHKVDFMSRTEAAHLPCVTERYRGRVCLSALSCRYDAARDCAGYIRDHIRNRQKHMCELGGLGWWVSTCSTNASQTFHGSSTSLALSEWRLKTQVARKVGGLHIISPCVRTWIGVEPRELRHWAARNTKNRFSAEAPEGHLAGQHTRTHTNSWWCE